MAAASAGTDPTLVIEGGTGGGTGTAKLTLVNKAAERKAAIGEQGVGAAARGLVVGRRLARHGPTTTKVWGMAAAGRRLLDAKGGARADAREQEEQDLGAGGGDSDDAGSATAAGGRRGSISEGVSDGGVSAAVEQALADAGDGSLLERQRVDAQMKVFRMQGKMLPGPRVRLRAGPEGTEEEGTLTVWDGVEGKEGARLVVPRVLVPLAPAVRRRVRAARGQGKKGSSSDPTSLLFPFGEPTLEETLRDMRRIADAIQRLAVRSVERECRRAAHAVRSGEQKARQAAVRLRADAARGAALLQSARRKRTQLGVLSDLGQEMRVELQR